MQPKATSCVLLVLAPCKQVSFYLAAMARVQATLSLTGPPFKTQLTEIDHRAWRDQIMVQVWRAPHAESTAGSLYIRSLHWKELYGVTFLVSL